MEKEKEARFISIIPAPRPKKFNGIPVHQIKTKDQTSYF